MTIHLKSHKMENKILLANQTKIKTMASFPGLTFSEKKYLAESTHGEIVIPWIVEKPSRPGWRSNICQAVKNFLWHTSNMRGLRPFQCFHYPPRARHALVDFVYPVRKFRKFLNPKSWKSVLSGTQEIRFQPFKEVMLISQPTQTFPTNLFVNPRKILI